MINLLQIIGIIIVAESNNIKYWKHSNSWRNSEQWDFEPTFCDSATLHDVGFEYSVLLSNTVQLNSLKFSSNSELIFGDKANISLSSQCYNVVENTFRTKRFSWSDPSNWLSSRDEDSVFQLADSDKIPCWSDTVVFNESKVFSVLVDEDIEIGAAFIGDTEMTTASLMEFAQGPGRSQLQFENLAGVRVTGRTVCTFPQGCLCGNQIDCSRVECPNTACSKQIKSKGICCHYCGSEIRFKPPTGFYLMKFKETLLSYLRDKIPAGVKLTISLQEYESSINIQITVADHLRTDETVESAGYESSQLGHKIYDYIIKYDIVRSSEITMQNSHDQVLVTGPQKAQEPEPVYRGLQSWLLYVILSVAVVLLIVIVVLLVKCSQRYRDNHNNQRIRLDTGTLPSALDRRYKPCVDPDIPTYEEVLMEDMLTRGISPTTPRGGTAHPRSTDSIRRPGPITGRSGGVGGSYSEIPTTDISDPNRV